MTVPLVSPTRTGATFMLRTRIFLWKLNLSSTGTKSHTQGNFENFQSGETPHTGATERGTLEKLKVLTHHNTATHKETLKNSKSSHTTAEGPHTGKLFSQRGNLPKKPISSSKGILKNSHTGIFSWKTNLSSTGAVRSGVKKIRWITKYQYPQYQGK